MISAETQTVVPFEALLGRAQSLPPEVRDAVIGNLYCNPGSLPITDPDRFFDATDGVRAIVPLMGGLREEVRAKLDQGWRYRGGPGNFETDLTRLVERPLEIRQEIYENLEPPSEEEEQSRPRNVGHGRSRKSNDRELATEPPGFEGSQDMPSPAIFRAPRSKLAGRFAQAVVPSIDSHRTEDAADSDEPPVNWREVAESLVALRAESDDPSARLALACGLDHRSRTPDEIIRESERRMDAWPADGERFEEAVPKEFDLPGTTTNRANTSDQHPGTIRITTPAVRRFDAGKLDSQRSIRLAYGDPSGSPIRELFPGFPSVEPPPELPDDPELPESEPPRPAAERLDSLVEVWPEPPAGEDWEPVTILEDGSEVQPDLSIPYELSPVPSPEPRLVALPDSDEVAGPLSLVSKPGATGDPLPLRLSQPTVAHDSAKPTRTLPDPEEPVGEFRDSDSGWHLLAGPDLVNRPVRRELPERRQSEPPPRLSSEPDNRAGSDDLMVSENPSDPSAPSGAPRLSAEPFPPEPSSSQTPVGILEPLTRRGTQVA